jgi:hypothetical protein
LLLAGVLDPGRRLFVVATFLHRGLLQFPSLDECFWQLQWYSCCCYYLLSEHKLCIFLIFKRPCIHWFSFNVLAQNTSLLA